MRNITKISENSYHVISEPGDMTRYEYNVYFSDIFVCIKPAGSTFTFPSIIMLDDIVEINFEHENIDGFMRDNAQKIYSIRDGLQEAEKKVNPFTIAECIRGIHQIEKDSDNFLQLLAAKLENTHPEISYLLLNYSQGNVPSEWESLLEKRFKEFREVNLYGVKTLTYDSLTSKLEIIYKNGIVDIVEPDRCYN